jgi:hypothetical protein
LSKDYKILIFGDSFSADTVKTSWPWLLEQKYTVQNYSLRGASEYRLYCSFIKNLQAAQSADAVIFFHTNPHRVFVPDHVDYMRRHTNSHTHSDMVANDVMTDPKWRNIADMYYRNFFDEGLQNTLYAMLIQNISSRLKNVLHCSGFLEPGITKSFYNLRETNPGTINHFDSSGNQIVYNYIEQWIEDAKRIRN